MHLKQRAKTPGGRLSIDVAEVIGLQAVTFIASDEDALSGLLGLTGLDLESLKHALMDPAKRHETLAGVLTILLQNEQRLLAFCHTNDLDPGTPAAALRRLAPENSEFDFNA